MKQACLLTVVGLAALPVLAKEIVVDASGKAKGSVPTIQKGIAAAAPGDTVLVKGGVYAERLLINKDYGSSPLTVKAAPGERVIVSGFVPITGWKELGKGVFVATADETVKDLFVGYQPQQCARWPEDGTRLPILTAETASRTFKTEPVKDNKALAVLAKDPKDAVCFYYFARGNAFGSPAIASYDATTGDIRFEEKQWNRWIGPEGNKYSFMNHPAFITRPGDWATADGKVYFKPVNKEDLAKTCFRAGNRPQVTIGHWKNRVRGVILDGLEITGSGAEGVKIGGDDVVVRNCLIHHNKANGIAARGVKNVTLASNVVIANFNGIGLASVTKGLVEGNEVAHNYMDGLIVAGNISGKKTGTPGANEPTRDVVVRRNYLHHHFLMGHPDNFQMYRDVYNTTIEENFDVWGGQSLMAEEVEDVEFNGNVFMGCEAMMVICGHGNSHRWNFRRNTFWGAGYGVFSFTGHDYLVEGNLFVDSPMPYSDASAKVKSSGNHFSPSYIGKTTKPWRTYTDLKKAQDELGQEAGSTEGDAKLANFPSAWAIAGANGSALDSLAFRKGAPVDAFKPGDQIELNGDGKLRTVVSSANGILTFKPALPLPPFRGVMVANWKKAKSTTIDNRSSAKVGATISTVAFANGDLLGKGRRTLPEIPADVAAAWPDPNRIVCPPAGH